MKKKLTAIFLCVALVAIAVVGASLAYFTDSDKADNVFTTGNVKIELIEQERDGQGGLKTFEDGKALLPIVGDALGETDELGLPTAKNFVDKIVTVKNLASDAYVRVYVAIPSEYVSQDEPQYNVIHWLAGNKFIPAGGKADANGTNVDWKENMGGFVPPDEDSPIMFTDKDGYSIEYDVFYADYRKVLTKDEVTGSAFMVGIYLDKDLDYDAEKECYMLHGKEFSTDLSNLTIPVFAVGVQADGFNSAEEAFNAALGEDYNPFTEHSVLGD